MRRTARREDDSGGSDMDPGKERK
ncbi:hypothetical protein A2U01_0099500, partial [Trifolium medium]|nr:hypothetical protein [Trifolium medium]